MSKEITKQEMNIAFAQSVLMFAIMDIRKNGVSQEEDYMTPMLTAVHSLQNGYSEEDLCQMMEGLAQVAEGMFGKAGVEV
jgi:hypothetical protein